MHDWKWVVATSQPPFATDEIEDALIQRGIPGTQLVLWTSDERVADLVRERTGVEMIAVHLADGRSGWVLLRGGQHA
jgi:hypothetical protein